MPVRKTYRRETSEVSCCLKYVIFTVNVLFWVSCNIMKLVYLRTCMGGYGCATLIQFGYSQFKSEMLNYNKYVIDSQLLGLCILAIGIWAWSEKDIINNLSKLTTIALDPAFILICSGTITFIIGFAGCVGALRENTCLLAAVSIKLQN